METKQQSKIHKDMTIGDVAAEFPEAVDVLSQEGIQCVGCGAAYYETIEQGLMSHGKDEEYIATVVAKMNEVVENGPVEQVEKPKFDVSTAKFEIQESAVSKLKEIMKSENKEDHGLRIEVVAGGCSGYRYGLDFDHQKRPDDLVFEKEGVHVYIDPESMSMINGGNIEYVESLQGAGFKINNPKVTGSCGCGESFS